MPTLLLSFKKNPGGGILLHGFLAPNDAASRSMMQKHAGVCPSYGPELRAGNTIEETIQVEEIRAFDDESIAEWVAEAFGLEDDEEPGEEDDDEPQEEVDEEEEEEDEEEK
ncbi:MAG: hypothetical protein ACYC7B_04565 [Burkholderiales bacterium]